MNIPPGRILNASIHRVHFGHHATEIARDISYRPRQGQRIGDRPDGEKVLRGGWRIPKRKINLRSAAIDKMNSVGLDGKSLGIGDHANNLQSYIALRKGLPNGVVRVGDDECASTKLEIGTAEMGWFCMAPYIEDEMWESKGDHLL